MYTLLQPSKSHLWILLFLESGDSDLRGRRMLSILNGDMESCTARAIDRAVEPVSLTLSKVTFGRSSSSLSLLICLGDRPLGSVCALPWLAASSSRGSMMVLLRLEGDRTAVVYMRGSDCTTTGMR